MTSNEIAALLGGRLDGNVFYPPTEGRFAPAKHKASTHEMRPSGFTTEPTDLVVLTTCRGCGHTEATRPSKRLRKVREGFTPDQWSALVEEAEARRKAA